MADISLRPITEENFRPVIRMKVRDDQTSFVADNVTSIAQAYIYPTSKPFALYADDELVGFTWLNREADTGIDWIIRFMIGADHQGKGYGRAALKTIIEYLKQQPDVKQIRLSYVPGNEIAESLYRKVGFEATGEIDDGEIVMAYKENSI